MEFKRVKLLSGMLSAAAIAAMTGAPVFAEETADECLFLTNTLENGQDQLSSAADAIVSGQQQLSTEKKKLLAAQKELEEGLKALAALKENADD